MAFGKVEKISRVTGPHSFFWCMKKECNKQLKESRASILKLRSLLLHSFFFWGMVSTDWSNKLFLDFLHDLFDS